MFRTDDVRCRGAKRTSRRPLLTQSGLVQFILHSVFEHFRLDVINSCNLVAVRRLPGVIEMFRGVLGAITIAVVTIIVANYAPLLNRHADQDKCTFGPVSNEQYRAYLRQAQSQPRPKLPAFSNDGREIGRYLNSQLSAMLTPEATIYERIAIMHAVLRAIGAEYLNTNGSSDRDPFQSAHSRRHDVEFNYQVDINRLVLFQPWPRQLWIVGGLRDPDIPRTDITIQGDRIAAALVSLFDHPADEFLAGSGQNCPPVPTPAEAARYQIKQK